MIASHTVEHRCAPLKLGVLDHFSRDKASLGREGEQKLPPSFVWQIKLWTVKWKSVRSMDVHDKIRKGELPPLPTSKADGKPMCLA